MNRTLPTRGMHEHPDLDQLKRQAKELLRAFLADEPEATVEVQAHYTRANRANFALHDAQLVLARSYGFESWPKLKAYIDGVTVRRIADTVRANDVALARKMLETRPELANMAMSYGDEHQPIHFAVMNRLPEMVRLLMQHGASRLRRIAEAALVGLAYGAQAGPQKSAAASWAAGLGAGAMGETQRAQGQDLLKRQQAREEYEEQQRTITNRATVWMHNVQRYRDYLEAAKLEADMNPEYQQTQAWKDSIDEYNADTPGEKHDYKILSPEQAQSFLLPGPQGHTADSHPMGNWVVIGALPPALVKDNNNQPIYNDDGSPKMQGRVLITPADETGKWKTPQAFIDSLQQYANVLPGNLRNLKADTGVDPRQFALINMGYMKAKKDVQAAWKVEKLASADGTERLVSFNPLTNEMREGVSSGPGTPTYNHDPKTNKWYKTDPKTQESAEVPVTQVLLKVQQEVATVESTKAGAFEKTETGRKAAEETKQLQEWDTGGPDGKGRIDAFGNPVGATGMDKKEYLARVKAYTKDYSKDLNQLDAARSQLSDIIKNAEKGGKLPGADAVVGIFDAIGISSAPLKGRGFRINNSVVGEHVEGTRNAWQGMALRLSRLTPQGTGQIVSLQQLKDYERIMDQARHDAYVGATNDAVNRGIGIQIAPRGNGQPADDNTMDIFITLSKNDPKLASALLKQFGWVAPGE